ncbi:GntR family transcriptional regulator [Mesorhizobium sp. M1405]
MDIGRIRRAIRTGRLGPGPSIDKAALCEQLGVSRFPVAAAINRLAFERLVVVQPSMARSWPRQCSKR